MVNHYATLLLNLSGENTPGGISSYFVNRGYSKLNLPVKLKSFYDILFPPNTSGYQKQFLCYNYLRILNATRLISSVTKHDPRVTYDLDSLTEYFRTYRISQPTTNNSSYSILVFGKYITTGKNNYYYNSFSVTQLGSTNTISVFSDIDHAYLKGGNKGNKLNPELVIDVIQSAGSSTSSTIIPVGDTGLSFSINGPINIFNQSSNKSWSFIAESPLSFNFNDLFNSLVSQNNIVDSMLSYSYPDDTKTNENIWATHFNDIYRFAGLLNCYVERVNGLL
jgi:hypothetical protein